MRQAEQEHVGQHGKRECEWIVREGQVVRWMRLNILEPWDACKAPLRQESFHAAAMLDLKFIGFTLTLSM